MSGLFLFTTAWLVAAAFTRYLFRSDILLLTPSAVGLLLYGAAMVLEPLTREKNPGTLFTIWSISFVVPVLVAAMISFIKGAPPKPFFWSLLFQIPFLIYLYYHGGLLFTHKF